MTIQYLLLFLHIHNILKMLYGLIFPNFDLSFQKPVSVY